MSELNKPINPARNDFNQKTSLGFEYLSLPKPDGRKLHLYSHSKIELKGPIMSPGGPGSEKVMESRWHPFKEEWVAYGSHRQNRTFMPPPDFNPLKPSGDPHHPTELPLGDYEVCVFENLFPSLSKEAYLEPSPGKKASKGLCEVVVFSQDPQQSLGSLPKEQIILILKVWGHRLHEYAQSPDFAYAMPFENRGVQMGVTLHHPHGQVYVYDHIPPVPFREFEAEKKYFAKTGRTLGQHVVEKELREKTRLIMENTHAFSAIPHYARYPHELLISPKRSVASLNDLNDQERDDFAEVLKNTLKKFDHIFSVPMPYLLIAKDRPLREDASYHHFRIEVYGALRSKDRLKYLAGTELGAGLFANDALPEQSITLWR